MAQVPRVRVAVLISAIVEWKIVRDLVSHGNERPSPYGDWFVAEVPIYKQLEKVLFFHGGWGKIDAAASTQYVLGQWMPRLIVNLGTCGGFRGAIRTGDIVLAERTLVYDIIEQMSDPEEALAYYATDLDLSWLRQPYPQPVERTLLISGDRDLVAEDVPSLQARFNARAGDWESGAIAHVAACNRVPCLILRGVTDLVGPDGGEAYDGTLDLFTERSRQVLGGLIEALPQWLSAVEFLKV